MARRFKKAQGLSMNVIIIAALALLVLTVLAIVLFGRINIFSSGLQACRGACVEAACPAQYPVAIPSHSGCEQTNPATQGGTPKIKKGKNKQIFCCINPTE